MLVGVKEYGLYLIENIADGDIVNVKAIVGTEKINAPMTFDNGAFEISDSDSGGGDIE